MSPAANSSFQPARAKLTIGSLDDKGLTVRAQYNPKELQVDQNVPWKKPDAATQTGAQPAASGNTPSSGGTGTAPSGGGGGGAGGGSSSPGEDYMVLEFTGAEGRSMTVELLFDGYEEGGRTVDVAAQVATLETMARVRDPMSQDEKMRRPHHCTVSWGDRGLPRFDCVIENLSTKYSMFSTEGKPLRATCTVKLKEAKSVDKKKKG